MSTSVRIGRGELWRGDCLEVLAELALSVRLLAGVSVSVRTSVAKPRKSAWHAPTPVTTIVGAALVGLVV